MISVLCHFLPKISVWLDRITRLFPLLRFSMNTVMFSCIIPEKLETEQERHRHEGRKLETHAGIERVIQINIDKDNSWIRMRMIFLSHDRLSTSDEG